MKQKVNTILWDFYVILLLTDLFKTLNSFK